MRQCSVFLLSDLTALVFSRGAVAEILCGLNLICYIGSSLQDYSAIHRHSQSLI